MKPFQSASDEKRPDLDKTIPLIVDRSYAARCWGNVEVYSLKLAAIKSGYSLFVTDEAHVEQLIGFRFVLVCGVDRKWLEDLSAVLKRYEMEGILISGKTSVAMYSYIVLTSQATAIRQSLELLLRHGKARPALFGIKRGDQSDTWKADVFLQEMRKRKISDSDVDIYWYDTDISQSFQVFARLADKYDSVICSNDLIGAYLIKECCEIGLRVPEDLFVIGNANTWIGSHMSPSLTTVCYPSTGNVCVKIYKLLQNAERHPALCGMPFLFTACRCGLLTPPALPP